MGYFNWGVYGSEGRCGSIEKCNIKSTGEVKKIAAGSSFFCLLRNDGAVFVIGWTHMVSSKMKNILYEADAVNVYGNKDGFAILRSNGSLITVGQDHMAQNGGLAPSRNSK